MIKTTHSFDYSVTMSTESVDTEVLGFLLFFGSVDNFNCTFRSSILEKIHHHIVKVSTSIQKGFKFFQLSILFPSSLQTSRHLLTHGKLIELTRVYSYEGSTRGICKPNFSVTYNCFTCIKQWKDLPPYLLGFSPKDLCCS